MEQQHPGGCDRRFRCEQWIYRFHSLAACQYGYFCRCRFQGDFSTLNVDIASAQFSGGEIIQEGLDLLTSSTLFIGTGFYPESPTIDDDVTIGNGNPGPVDIRTLTMNAGGGTATLIAPLKIRYLTLTSGFFDIHQHDLTVDSTITGGSSTSYVLADSTGRLVRNNIDNTAKDFPIGTDNGYRPVTFNDNNNTGDNIGMRVKTPQPAAPALPADALDFVDARWDIVEGTPGGSDATLPSTGCPVMRVDPIREPSRPIL